MLQAGGQVSVNSISRLYCSVMYRYQVISNLRPSLVESHRVGDTPICSTEKTILRYNFYYSVSSASSASSTSSTSRNIFLLMYPLLCYQPLCCPCPPWSPVTIVKPDTVQYYFSRGFKPEVLRPIRTQTPPKLN